MNGMRFGLYLLGGLLVIGGLVMLFFESGLAAWVPAGIALAGLLVLVGLLVVGLSDRARLAPRETVEHIHHDDNRARGDTAAEGPTTVVERNEFVSRTRTPEGTTQRRRKHVRRTTNREPDDMSRHS